MVKYLLLLLSILLLFSCSKTDESDWTILIYMAADNSLDFQAVADIEDMMQAEFSDNINLVVQVDFSESNPTPAAYRYQIFPGLKERISFLGEIDSGDKNELTAFANWGFNKFPSEKQALILWSHGNSWYEYFCPDEESGNTEISVSAGELRQSIKNINEHLEIILFDACNMQSLEVAAEIYEYTDFIIASEGGVNSEGFPYQEFFSIWESPVSTTDLCNELGFQYHKFYSDNEIYPYSCSVLQSSLFSDLIDKLTEFTTDWSENAADEIFLQSRQECIEFNDNGFVNPALDVDVKEFFTHVHNSTQIDSLTRISADLLELTDACYIFQNTSEYPTGYSSDDVGSAIIWFPDAETQGFYDMRKQQYQLLQFSQTNWLDFLENSFSK